MHTHFKLALPETIYDSTSPTPPVISNSQRKFAAQQARRPTKTGEMEKLHLNDPKRVKDFRKIIDRQSGKPPYKTAKFKITQIMNHIYVTDKERRKNHICIKPNFQYSISVCQNTLSDRLPATTSAGAVNRAVLRSKPVLMEQRLTNPSFSDPVVVDLTADSSSEGSSGSSHPHVLKETTPVTACPPLSEDSPPVKFLRPSDTLTQLPSATAVTNTILTPSSSEAQFTGSGLMDFAVVSSTPAVVSSVAQERTTQDASSELRSLYPSLSLAQ